MTLWSSFALIGAMFLLAASPGPGVFATISRAIASGFTNSSILVAGIVVGDIIFLLLAIYGLNMIANLLGDFFTIVKYVGGIYLIYLGYKIWTSSNKIHEINANYELSIKTNFFSGLFITLANPKVIIFYLGFLPAFMNLEILTSYDILLAIVLVSITLASVLLTYAYMASRAKELLNSKSAVNKLNKTSGSVMMGAGTLLLLKN
ncbi:MAG TPA: LysE family translocator [Arcobacter sp.]|nr:LysE family translocator [Arcobacter sp.]